MEKINVGEMYLKILNGEEILWNEITENYEIDDQFIEEFNNKLDWYNLCRYQKLSEKIIDKYFDKIEWICFSIYQKLDLEIIEKYKDKICWYWIIANNKYSEDFLWKYREYIPTSINIISRFQNVSKDFINNFEKWGEQNGIIMH